MTGIIETVAAAVRADGWENTLLGIGGKKDPSAYTTFSSRAPLSLQRDLLEAIYVEDHFAATIVEALPFDAMRPGWELSIQDAPDSAARIREAYTKAERRLGVAEELSQGAVWGRLFGGAVTWIGADDGREPNMPLDEERVQKVRFLHTFDARDVDVARYYQDPKHPRFQKPEVYRIRPLVMTGVEPGGGGLASIRSPARGKAIYVHESRCVVWGGRPTTDRRRQVLGGWDDSVLEPAWDALRQIAEDYSAKSLLLGRVSQAIYKIHELYEMIAGGKESVVKKRMDLLDRSRSRARAILLDTREEYEQTTQPLSGVDTMIDRSILRLASAAPMPVVRLMGQPLGSMEGTGDGGAHEWWAQYVSGWREGDLRPNHERIAELILRAREGPAADGSGELDWHIQYGELRQPTAKERAEVRRLEAETDAIRVDKGFASPEAIALQRFSPSAGADLVLDQETLERALERRRELEAQPPKDNAELGTVGARTDAVLKVAEAVIAGRIPRESGVAQLVEIHRFKREVAEQMIGPKDFEPKVLPGQSPGPDPDAGFGGGAGAPQGLPGENDGGDPNEEQTPTGNEGESS